jgi:hypothetical protein
MRHDAYGASLLNDSVSRLAAYPFRDPLCKHLAEVIFQVDPHDIDHRQLASLISDEAGELIRYASELSDFAGWPFLCPRILLTVPGHH